MKLLKILLDKEHGVDIVNFGNFLKYFGPLETYASGLFQRVGSVISRQLSYFFSNADFLTLQLEIFILLNPNKRVKRFWVI